MLCCKLDCKGLCTFVIQSELTSTATVITSQQGNVWLAGCRLSGELHHVHTGVALIVPSGKGAAMPQTSLLHA